MRPITVHTDDGRLLADRAWAASAIIERARGWLGKPALEAGEGLLLSPASSIHSFGMRFAFDLVYLDRQGMVLKLCPGLRPGRFSFGPFGAWISRRGLQALELPLGSIASAGLRLGQVLQIEERG